MPIVLNGPMLASLSRLQSERGRAVALNEDHHGVLVASINYAQGVESWSLDATGTLSHLGVSGV